MEGEGKGMGGWYINQRQMATVCGERCKGRRNKMKIQRKDDPDLHFPAVTMERRAPIYLLCQCLSPTRPVAMSGDGATPGGRVRY